MIILLDFDGTCVKHEYPKIGKDIGAIPVLQKIIQNKHDIILFTMRSGKELNEAISWFDENNIPLFGVNNNPTQYTWTQSPKPYGHIIIDDTCLGIPMISSEEGRPYVDWNSIENMLKEKHII